MPIKSLLKKMHSLDQDDKILLNNTIGTMVIKGFSIIIGFATTSVYISYFNDSTVLGIWFTLLSILQWILTFDFGIGNGLRNKLAPCIDKRDEKQIHEYISSGYIALILVSLFVIVIGSLLIATLDWRHILNVNDNQIAKSTLMIAILVTFIGIILQFVLKIIISILYALRKNTLANSTTLVSNILLLAFLFIGKYLKYNSQIKLILLAFMYAFAVIIPLIVATLIVFLTDLRGFSPKFKYFNLHKARDVVSLGGLFFIIQLELLILTSTDSWFILYLFNAEDVVSYQIYYKLFSLPTTMFALLSQPLWSSVSIAIARKDYKWIIQKERMMYCIALAVSVFCLIEVFLTPSIIKIWIGEGGCEIDIKIALWFGILSVAQLFMYASTSIANGMSQIKCQAICNFVAVVLKLSVTFIFASFINHWISILMVETIGTLIVAISQPIDNYRNIRKMKAMEV